MLKQLAARKSVAAITREIESGPKLNRVLDRRALTSVGLGSMIGSGIFVLTGTVAAQHTGPAVTLAFLVAAIGCGLAALCYAELASMIPISGSAYSYTYATLGEGVAWFVGWNLALEYVMSGAAVAVGWSGYVVNLLAEFGLHLPDALTNAPLGKGADNHLVATGALVNVPAVLIVALLTWVCYVGVKQSTRVNNVMVVIKILIIILFIAVGIKYVSPDLWQPYLPANTGNSGQFGFSGVMQGAAIIFFAYIGFDQAATTAQEARNPQRDVPWGIIAALLICDDAVCPDVCRDDGHGVLHGTQRRGAGRRRARRASGTEVARAAGQDRRDRRPHVGDPDVAARPAAHFHGDVARRPAAAGDAEGAPEVPHAARGDDRHGRGRPRSSPASFRSTCSAN